MTGGVSTPASIAVRQQILKLAANGYLPTALDGMTARQVAGQCVWLTEHGQLWTAKTGHRTIRYFATKAAADAYRNNTQPVLTRKPSGAVLSADAPVIPREVKVTVCPTRWA